MLDRMQAGTVPDKPHTALRDDAGRLRNEECLTRDGFEGPFTILYHVERPHTAAVAPAAHGWTIAPPVSGEHRPLARRHYRSQDLPVASAAPIDARAPLLHNQDVVISAVKPNAADPVYFANGDGDDLYFVLEGGGVLRSALGDVAFAPGDYVFVPKGLVHRFVPGNGPQVWLSIECAGGFGLLGHWRNEVCQLRMDAPYTHRDFRRPTFIGPHDEGLRELVVKRGHAIPCPYPHSSVACDEVIFYAAGNFTSRRGVGPGSLSHHPAGVIHGPHPGAYEGSIGQHTTDELAVMLDTTKPLYSTAAARNLEDPQYHASFSDNSQDRS